MGDLRAPTPTAAAEMAAEELSQVYLKLEESRTRLNKLALFDLEIDIVQRHLLGVTKAKSFRYISKFNSR